MIGRSMYKLYKFIVGRSYGDEIVLGLISMMFGVRIGVISPSGVLIRIVTADGDCDIVVVNNGGSGIDNHYTGTGNIWLKE